jgi:hypothetical protein
MSPPVASHPGPPTDPCLDVQQEKAAIRPCFLFAVVVFLHEAAAIYRLAIIGQPASPNACPGKSLLFINHHLIESIYDVQQRIGGLRYVCITWL